HQGHIERGRPSLAPGATWPGHRRPGVQIPSWVLMKSMTLPPTTRTRAKIPTSATVANVATAIHSTVVCASSPRCDSLSVRSATKAESPPINQTHAASILLTVSFLLEGPKICRSDRKPEGASPAKGAPEDGVDEGEREEQ